MRRRKSQDTTLYNLLREQSADIFSQPPKKKIRIHTQANQESGSEPTNLFLQDFSFQDRVQRTKQIFDAGLASRPPAISEEVMAVMNCYSHGRPANQALPDTKAPIISSIAASPTNAQDPVEPVLCHGKRSNENRASANKSLQAELSEVSDLPRDDFPHNEDRQLLESKDFGSSPSSAQTEQRHDIRQASIRERKRAFKIAQGDDSMEWASSNPGLQCAGDHHTKPETSLE